jgi:hypothetical protein
LRFYVANTAKTGCGEAPSAVGPFYCETSQTCRALSWPEESAERVTGALPPPPPVSRLSGGEAQPGGGGFGGGGGGGLLFGLLPLIGSRFGCGGIIVVPGVVGIAECLAGFAALGRDFADLPRAFLAGGIASP